MKVTPLFSVPILWLASWVLVGCARPPSETRPRTERGRPRCEAPAGVEPAPLLVTIDDLPAVGAGPKAHEEMLAALASHRVPALGFAIAAKAESPAGRTVLERWLAAGVELGSHGYAHLSYSDVDEAEYLADLRRSVDVLAPLTEAKGQALRFFRFPYLREGNTEAKFNAARAYFDEAGLRSVPVTLDVQDWRFEKRWRSASTDERREIERAYIAELTTEITAQQSLGDRLLKRRAPGVLLLHASAIGGRRWDELFCWLRGRGFVFRSAAEVLADPALSDGTAFIGRYGPGHWDRVLAARRAAAAKRELEAILKRDAEAWNRGDLDAFVASYAEDALFLGASGLIEGRAAVLARYQKKYGEKPETMGELSLEVVSVDLAQGDEVTRTGAAVVGRVQGASVVARWRLRWRDRPPPQHEASGLTLLTFRRGAHDAWQIVFDASM